MRPATIFVRIVFPQAMRVIIPPVGNEVISMVKSTSLVSVIALAELLYTAQLIYARTYETIPLLIVASLWYLIIVSILSVGQHFLERYYRHHYMTEPMVAHPRTDESAMAGARCCSGIDLDVPPGSVMCIIGPSGSGKSTLLSCINHLERIDGGKLWVGGELVGYREHGGGCYELPRAPRRPDAATHRHGVPAVQPVPAHDRAREHHGGADPGEPHPAARGAASAR